MANNTLSQVGIITSVVWPWERWEYAQRCAHCGCVFTTIGEDEGFCSSSCMSAWYADVVADQQSTEPFTIPEDSCLCFGSGCCRD